MTDIRIEPCEYCDTGWCEGSPIPTPDGPYFPSHRCTACDGYGLTTIEYFSISEDELFEVAP